MAVDRPADLVLTGGRIATMDAARSWASALAVRDGRIVAVGSDAAVAAHIGLSTRVIELRGRTVTPGFQDAHVHPVHGGLARLRCELHDTRSRDEVLATIENSPKPVVAAIHGTALGGGFETALVAHYRVAVPSAKVGLPEVKIGILPGAGGTQRLPRLVGEGRALELLLTGEPVDAAEAYRIGLVNRVVPRERLLDECRAIARKIMAAAPVATRLTLEAVRRGGQLSLGEALGLEADLFAVVAATSDMKEGTAAFLEKRPPKFQGK